MKEKISKLLVVLTVCLMASPCLAYAASPNTSASALHSSDTVAVAPSNVALYDNPDISSKSEFDTYDFSTPSDNSYDIRVWFGNQGSDGVKVSLYKETKSESKSMGSFSVSAGTNAFKDFSGSEGTTYHIVIDSDNGGVVRGYLRARQLDAINAIPSSEPAIVVPQNTIFVPQNTGGATGKSCGDFVAAGSNVSFTMTWMSNGSTYNVQLYKGEIGQGIPVGDNPPEYATMEVGSGYVKGNLEVGASYYFVVSSNDTKASGANGRYTVDQY